MGGDWSTLVSRWQTGYRVEMMRKPVEIGVRLVDDPAVRRKPWLVIVRDAAVLCLYIASFFSNTINWRGMRYRVHGAFLIPLQADARSRGKLPKG